MADDTWLLKFRLLRSRLEMLRDSADFNFSEAYLAEGYRLGLDDAMADIDNMAGWTEEEILK